MAQGIPDKLEEVRKVLGRYSHFEKCGKLIKNDGEVMSCFILVAKEEIIAGNYFEGFYMNTDEKEMIGEMLKYLSTDFSFSNLQFLNYYMVFLGFLMK